MKQIFCSRIPNLAALLLLWTGLSYGASVTYFEDFTSTQYKDTLNTTAWWDTASGKLRLFPLPRLVGTSDTPGYAWDAVISGDYVFVADHGYGLQVIDISDPVTPTIIGSYNTPGSARGVSVSGNYAYVADQSAGLVVIDVSNPTVPILVGSYDTPGSARGVTVSGNYAYVADADSGLQVIDISDPAAPALVGTYDTPGYALGAAVSGSHVFVADDNIGGLQVIDVTDPAAPSLAGVYDTPGSAWNVAISGQLALVADETSGLVVIDISDPTAPALSGAYDTPGNAYGVTFAGNYAYVADNLFGIQIIDISNPLLPVLAGSADTPGEARSAFISGEFVYVADAFSGLQVIKARHLTIPQVTGSYDTPDIASDIIVFGRRAFVADGMSGLLAIDISDPAVPALLGSYNTPGNARSIAISGNLALVADADSGLQVIDISNPIIPALVGAYDTPESAWGIAVSGNLAFVADGTTGLQVIDISDPAAPVLIGSYDTPGYANGIQISGDYAFVADMSFGLQVIDISDPAVPELTGSYDTPGLAWDVNLSGDHAFVADDIIGGLQVIDISDPAAPALIGSYDTPGSAHRVDLSGDYAFVADMSSGLQVIDISNPAIPKLVDSYGTPGDAQGVYISGNFAFVAGQQSGLQVIQVFQSEVDPNTNQGWSLPVNTSNDTISRVRLTTTQTDTINWELSANGGLSWQPVAPDGGWHQMAAPGTTLVWRSTHLWSPGVNPEVTQIQIKWGWPDIDLVSNHLGFGTVAVGRTANDSLTLYNTGTDTLHVYLVSTGLPEFQPSPTEFIILAGDSEKVAVSFTPLAAQSYADTLSITSDDADEGLVKVALSGTGAYVELYASALTAPAELTAGRDTLTVGALVGNSGDPASGPFRISLRISPDSTISTSDDTLATIRLAGLAPSEEETLSIAVLLPKTAPRGNVFIGIIADDLDEVVEGDKINNIIGKPFTYQVPVIHSVIDVPLDQGGQVFLSWYASPLDPAGGITEYTLWRTIEVPLVQGALEEVVTIASASEWSPQLGDNVYRSYETPAGPVFWEHIATQGAFRRDSYGMALPTLFDSTAAGFQYHYFQVIAHTPDPATFYLSACDSGYSVDNLAPGIPQNLLLVPDMPNMIASWNANEETDLDYYAVYARLDSIGSVEGAVLVVHTIDTSLTLPDTTEGLYILVTATDFTGNESPASNIVLNPKPTGIDITQALPERIALHQNVPNPFNPTTTIRFDLAGTGKVKLQIYDVAGRWVRTLVDRVLPQARHSVEWDSRDAGGKLVASGVYFCRLTVDEYRVTRKLTLLR